MPKYSHATLYLYLPAISLPSALTPPTLALNRPAPTMILVQKPTAPFSLCTHRRHPSTPTVVVLPTRTPGLLTLSKPPRPSPQRQNQRQIPRPLPKSKSTQVVPAPLLNSSADITDNKKSGVIALPATPSPQPRGRGQIKHTNDRVQNSRRSPSYPAVHRKHSSPIPQPQLQQISSQAEVTALSSVDPPNISDPFLDNDSSVSSNPSSSPSLPFRRSANHKPSPSLVHSNAIPVPVTPRRQRPNISRSDPPPSYIRKQPRPIPAFPSALHHLPICEDMNDAADSGVPTTPSPNRCHRDNGLRTAPISSRTPGAFPFNDMGLPSSPSPVATKRGNKKHRRAPSEGVFHMSSDEDLSSSGPGGTIFNPNVRALFGVVNTSNPSSKMLPSAFSTPVRAIPPFKGDSASFNGSLSKEKQSECEGTEKAAGYFASSMFQNSPGPEVLPDPLLF